MSAIPDSTLVDLKDRLIADLQRQLAERTAERDESLEQQTATAEVLQVINSSPGDLAPVFDAIIQTAARLCAADFGALSMRDAEVYRVRASFAVEPTFARYLKGRTFGRETITWRTVATIALIVPGVILVALTGSR